MLLHVPLHRYDQKSRVTILTERILNVGEILQRSVSLMECLVISATVEDLIKIEERTFERDLGHIRARQKDMVLLGTR